DTGLYYDVAVPASGNTCLGNKSVPQKILEIKTLVDNEGKSFESRFYPWSCIYGITKCWILVKLCNKAASSGDFEFKERLSTTLARQ
ncbi:MAG: hypothetical protein BJ554DRAFT_6906, partial [Olpidium bornovanus]